MKAKNYLRQLNKLDKLISNKMAEKARWQEIARGTTSFSSGERVQSSGNQQKMASAVERYVDIEFEIVQSIDALIDKRLEIIGVIEQLNAAEYDLLHKVYVQYMTLYEAAEALNKSYSWVTTIHGRALKNVQRLLDERKEEQWQV